MQIEALDEGVEERRESRTASLTAQGSGIETRGVDSPQLPDGDRGIDGSGRGRGGRHGAARGAGGAVRAGRRSIHSTDSLPEITEQRQGWPQPGLFRRGPSSEPPRPDEGHGKYFDAVFDNRDVTAIGSILQVFWRISVFGFDGLKVGRPSLFTRRKE